MTCTFSGRVKEITNQPINHTKSKVNSCIAEGMRSSHYLRKCAYRFQNTPDCKAPMGAEAWPVLANAIGGAAW